MTGIDKQRERYMKQNKDDWSILDVIRLSALLHYLLSRSNPGDPEDDSQK